MVERFVYNSFCRALPARKGYVKPEGFDCMSDKLLEVKNLSVEFPGKRGVVHAVNGISYDVFPGEVMGIVGESGSGKSAAAYAVMQLLKPPGYISGGEIFFDGRDVRAFSRRELENFRGNEIGMIFQDPMQCLDPVFTIGSQLTETLHAHMEISKADAVKTSVEMLRSVGIHNPEGMMKRYPHELSGGMQQRVMIAIALLCKPRLLIADEATTALDVTIQDQIIRLLRRFKDESGMSIIFITHNFGLVADICDRVSVMYGGLIMEQGTVDDVFYASAHPYTRGLIHAIPKADPTAKEKLTPIYGAPIDPFDPPSGCVFHPRCAHCMEICRTSRPPETEVAAGHTASCWLLENTCAEVV